MYICQVTGKTSAAGEKLNRIVVETRQRSYTRTERNPDTGLIEDVEVGRGWEIVREIRATAEGVAEWESMSEAQRLEHLRHV